MTLVLLDTNTYLRLAKRIRPLLGKEFGQKKYVLTVLKDVEREVRRNPRLLHKFPWFNDEVFGQERDAARIRLKPQEKLSVGLAASVLRGYVLSDVDRYVSQSREPPSDVDCNVLAFAQSRSAIVVTDDLGMHLLARDFQIVVWHGWTLLAKMRTGKIISDNLIREIFAALDSNNDLPLTWAKAKHSTFARLFGGSPK